MSTRAPSATNRRAIASPMPVGLPRTITDFPAILELGFIRFFRSTIASENDRDSLTSAARKCHGEGITRSKGDRRNEPERRVRSLRHPPFLSERREDEDRFRPGKGLTNTA